MKKQFVVLMMLCGLTTACGFNPWSFDSSSEEPTPEYDIDALNYQENVIVSDTFDTYAKERFLAVSEYATSQFKTAQAVGKIYYNDIDEDTSSLETVDYLLETDSTMYNNNVFETNIHLKDDPDVYTREVQFVRNENVYDYYYDHSSNEIEEKCYKHQTSKTNVWDACELTVCYMLQRLYDEDEFGDDLEIGLDKDGNLVACYSEYKTGDTTIYVSHSQSYTVPRIRKTQFIYYFEKTDDGYRQTEITFFEEYKVKFDFKNMKESSSYHLRELDKVHLAVDYETDTGSFSSSELRKIMKLADEG